MTVPSTVPAADKAKEIAELAHELVLAAEKSARDGAIRLSTTGNTFDLLCTRAEQLSDLTEAMVALDSEGGNAQLISRLSYLAQDLANQVKASISELGRAPRPQKSDCAVAPPHQEGRP